jgi:hypothetical protein
MPGPSQRIYFQEPQQSPHTLVVWVLATLVCWLPIAASLYLLLGR